MNSPQYFRGIVKLRPSHSRIPAAIN